MLTGRDAAHKRLAGLIAQGKPLPVDLRGRAICYVGPVDAVLDATGLVVIGKAERGPAAIQSIKAHGAAYLIAVGGTANLVPKAVRAARVLAFADLGMEAIHEFVVEDMPVTVAVDTKARPSTRPGRPGGAGRWSPARPCPCRPEPRTA